jgi:hypothetical protein
LNVTTPWLFKGVATSTMKTQFISHMGFKQKKDAIVILVIKQNSNFGSTFRFIFLGF